MPTYHITGPDGSEYEVTGNGTEQEALAHVQASVATPKGATELNAQYPGLQQFGIQIKDSTGGGTDWRGQPYSGRKMEFYPPNESYNPNPGKPTIELFSKDMTSKDALGEVFSHYLPQVDPQFREARSKFIASIDPQQKKMLMGDYQDQLRSGLFPKDQRPSFDQWLNTNGGDAFFRGYVADQYPKNYYRPDQVAMFEPLMQRISASPAQENEQPGALRQTLMAPVGAAEMLYQGATGAVASIPAAFAYGGAAVGKAFGANVDPSQIQNQVQSYLTHRPITQSAQAGNAMVGRAMAPIVNPIVQKYGEATQAVAQKSPFAGELMKAAPGAFKAASALVPAYAGVKNAMERPFVPTAENSAPLATDAPSKESLKQASQAAYKKVEDAGVVIAPESFNKAKEVITGQLKGIDPTLHPDTTAALKRITSTEGPVTLDQLETLRRIAKDAEASIKPADSRLASNIVDTIDKYAETLSAKDLLSGDPNAVSALKEARGLWSRARKADVLDNLVSRAELSAPNFSASGMENSLRTEFRALAKNQRLMRTFTGAEQEAIRKVAVGGPAENALRMLGKFAPTGAVSTGISSGLGFLAGGPAGAAALPAIGAAARYGASKMTMRNAELANALVRRGPP